MRNATINFHLAAAAAILSLLSGCNEGGSGTTSSASSGSTSAGGSTAPSASAVALSSANYSVAQEGGSVTLMVERSGPAAAAATVAYATADGSAVSGTDYTAASGTLSWAENDATSKSITVPISDATPYASDKSFAVTLSDPSASIELASPGSATVTISGGATGGVGALQLSSANYPIAQNAGTVTITVTRTGGSRGPVSIAYGTADGTAVSGADYTAAGGTLQWGDGDATAKTFNVAISNATPFSGSKSFAIGLSSPSAMASVGTLGSATVTIAGDGVVGKFQLLKSSYAIAQNAGSLTISVDRMGGSNGAASVAYKTANGTATAGTDFTAASGTLQWADGDTVAKTFAVSISNAKPFAGNKTFGVALSSPSGLASVTTPGSATVTINGDAAPPPGSLELSAASYSVAQNAGSLTVTVDRANGSNGAASVSYATASGTAVSGTDFTSSNGTLNWNAGDSSAKTFAVPVSDSTPFSGTKSFTVTLSGASGATLGNPIGASVSINGSAAAAVGSLQLSASTYTVAQSAGSLTVTVNRTGGSNGAVTAAYGTSDGSAIGGTDYTPVSGTLQWQNGDAAAKTFAVPVSNAASFSGSKSFNVTISSPTGGAVLTSPSTATATITGSGKAPSPPSGVTWMYLNGVKTLAGDFTGQNETTNYENSTSTGYNGGTKDILITSSNPYGYFIPYWAQNGQLPNPGYKNLILSLKPSFTGDTFGIHAEKVGDIDPNCHIELMNYGPTAVKGVWGNYVVPLTDLCIAGDATLYKIVLATHTGAADNWELDAIGFE